MLSRTFSEQWEALRPHFDRARSWLGTSRRTHSLLLFLWPVVALVIAILVIRRASTAKELSDLTSALASLIWALVPIAILISFSQEIRVILSRIRKGKFLGQEIELAELEAKTEAAEATSLMIISATGSAAGTGSATAEGVDVETAEIISAGAVQDEIEEVLREAGRSPRLGLMLLSAKIERAAHEWAAEAGLRGINESRALTVIVRFLVAARELPFEAAEALYLFTRVRNRMVHGDDADDEEVARAIDSGTRLLRLLLSRPRPQSETKRATDSG
jgi:hypothetical protein